MSQNARLSAAARRTPDPDPLQKPPHKAVMALAEAPDAPTPCPWCAREGVAEPGLLEAYEQRVGDLRVIHIWCSIDDDHTTCISGARETVFEGVPDLSERRPARGRATPRRYPAANERGDGGAGEGDDGA